MRSSPQDDRTARARIRDEALRLFADRGPDAVTVRDVAGAAGVSPALVVRHYRSKDGLRAAVDDHVLDVFEAMLAEVTAPGNTGTIDPSAAPSLAEAVTQHLPPDSAVPGYLGRMLVSGDSAGSALFRRLFTASRAALDGMVAAGLADTGDDPATRAAFLLLNDLALLMLRNHVADVLGTDPLTADGMQRWGAEVLSVYQHGLGGGKTRPPLPDHQEESR